MEYFVDMAIISSFSSFLFLGLTFYSSFSDLVNVTAEEETGRGEIENGKEERA